MRCAYQAYGGLSRCRPGKRSAPGNGAELRLMRCAYQAYGDFIRCRPGKRSAPGNSAELRLMALRLSGLRGLHPL